MTGKILAALIVITALIAGAGMYYLQVYGFYDEVTQEEVNLVSVVSPIRYRACFRTEMSLATLTETFVGLDKAEPRNAPGWFDCFDAAAIGAELEAGTALPFLSQKNVHYGVDRIVAITQDGRGYIWHELNDCGDKAYDGTVVGEECPERPAAD